MGEAGRKETSGPGRPGAVARAFHEATKHSFQSVRRRGHFLDWNNKPDPFKVIPGSDRMELPRGVPPTGVPVLEAVRGGTAALGEGSPGLLDLARLLVTGAGVRRRVHAGGQEFFFRTYASAGALYPVEVYAVCSDLPGLPAGVYHFDPRGPALDGRAGTDLMGATPPTVQLWARIRINAPFAADTRLGTMLTAWILLSTQWGSPLGEMSCGLIAIGALELREAAQAWATEGAAPTYSSPYWKRSAFGYTGSAATSLPES